MSGEELAGPLGLDRRDVELRLGEEAPFSLDELSAAVEALGMTIAGLYRSADLDPELPDDGVPVA